MSLLKNKRVLITAGPTREYLDPVRFLSNDSSGKMGYALAIEAIEMGAKVTLISGPVSLKPPAGIRVIRVVSAREMHKVAKKEFANADITICAAAVADFRPVKCAKQKIKKEFGPTQIKLVKNPDILYAMGKAKKKGQLLIGFALETNDLEKNAHRKLKEKNCDIIIANLPHSIGGERTSLKIFSKGLPAVKLNCVTKANAARKIFSCALSAWTCPRL